MYYSISGSNKVDVLTLWSNAGDSELISITESPPERFAAGKLSHCLIYWVS